jgi:lipid-A-disaccharide synthase
VNDAAGRKPLDVFLIAGEASGDALGGPLMAALNAECGGARFRGVGGAAMQAAGLATLFPIEELTAMGFNGVVAKLPTILRRMRDTVDAIIAAPPDLLVLIDSPDFNLRVAKRVRRALPNLTIIDYVSPTVWVWRPGRAKRMRPSIDRVLALLPFEPEAHQKLGGPPCSYVGHPLLERLGELRPSAEERRARDARPPVILVLPGSRRSEIARLSAVFGDTLARLEELRGAMEFVLPTLPALTSEISAAIAGWTIRPRVVATDEEKFAAFRRARAALAASGTVTLELALAGVPMVGAYRVSAIEAPILRRVIRSPSVILPNLILGENVIPEFHQENCTADNLVAAMESLVESGEVRQRQIEAFARLEGVMNIGDERPSARAARLAIETFKEKSRRVAACET